MATTYPVQGNITGTLQGLPTPDVPVSGPITGTIDVDLATGVTVGTATPPATPDPGELWTTVDGKLYIWRSGIWVQVA